MAEREAHGSPLSDAPIFIRNGGGGDFLYCFFSIGYYACDDGSWLLMEQDCRWLRSRGCHGWLLVPATICSASGDLKDCRKCLESFLLYRPKAGGC